MEITKSNLSLEDLEQFRDEEGYIDLDKAGLEVAKESREVRGNEHRVKNWVDFNGSEVLIKEEAQLDQRNYGVYARKEKKGGQYPNGRTCKTTWTSCS